MVDADAIYSEIARTWEALGLFDLLVAETNNYRAAIAVMAEHGWINRRCEIKPWNSDTWPHLVHIVSHCETPEGHGLKHAALEREMQGVVLKALRYKLVGDRVFHKKFGYGAVIGVYPLALEISFERGGTKKILPSFVSFAE